MAGQTIRVPRALFTLGEVAALCECSGDTVTRWVEVEQFNAIDSSCIKEVGFDRHEVDRLLRDKRTGERQLLARHNLVRLAYGELQSRARKLVETGGEACLEARYLDEELIQLVAEAVADLTSAECDRPAFDAWASDHRCPSSESVMRRLCIFTWTRVLARAVPEEWSVASVR